MNGTETGVDCGGACAACTTIGESMYGIYTGNTLGSLVIFYNPVVDMDTIFASPGVATNVELSEHDSINKLNVELKMTVSGTPITIKVPASVDSENTFSIANYPYTYLVINMEVNGTGTVNGNNLTANMLMGNGSGNPAGTVIDGDLNFTGTK